ncbi:hypothetical protein COU01_03875 [Candidatus Falkowbacteria bacterium CG10_big_fil_rev_8_21_14_0_10_44_15]|uniref:Uncharacterized protein n=1 Tax=Candidatus Falkowbacteria bacterium CG10_big_fil_rev_8_21_14_0_10_44_15 TaxID=1974569 RepID=A0A2H0UYZ9_9BACT|nr:MAG: hypothetical protein COU01_03875 [Candidatus Falkowbacteria bacterium CG10_big_fil_rev_8_21_14_0_10_44_15]
MPELNLGPKIEKTPPRTEGKLVDLKLTELEKTYEAIDRDESKQRKIAVAALLQAVADYLKKIYPNDWQYAAVQNFYQTVWREYKQISQDEQNDYQEALADAGQAVKESRSLPAETEDDFEPTEKV